jgi:hypothetical protein
MVHWPASRTRPWMRSPEVAWSFFSPSESISRSAERRSRSWQHAAPAGI